VTLKEISEIGYAGSESAPYYLPFAEPRDIWNARKFIQEHATEKLSLDKVAKTVGINPTHLSEKFKQVTGIKFVDYIARIRFESAKKLLEDVDLRVSEIAFAVGFQSLSQFNRVFKKLSEKSPKQYRALHKERAKPPLSSAVNRNEGFSRQIERRRY